MIKFAKNGSTVTTAAVKLARAFTGRKLVAFPGDHPFYSYDDWFIGKTACQKGIPQEISDLSVTFKSCDIQSLKDMFAKYPKQIACVITEPEKNFCGTNACACGTKGPQHFLREAIEICHQNGALFILDEMVTGFKTDFPGSMTRYNLQPDMATWGKGIANGFSFCALTGTSEVMDLGGIRKKGEEKVFLVSTTHGAETHSLVAAMATIDFFKSNQVIKHNHDIGKLLIEKINKVITDSGIQANIQISGSYWMPVWIFKNHKGEADPYFRTLMLQEMIKKGILFQGAFSPCYSHTESDIEFLVSSFSDSLKVYQQALDKGTTEGLLVGDPARPVFRKIL
jgi:glutamate-1-semialdehyde aminotransferase